MKRLLSIKYSRHLKLLILTVLCVTIAFLITEQVEAPRGAINLFPRPAGAKRPLTLYAVGNINLAGARTQNWFTERMEPGFAALLREVASADMAFGNLECQLISQPGSGGLQKFSASPQSAEALAGAGFDVLATANDVSSAFDAQALGETIASLRRVGIRHAGTGRTIDEAYEPAVIERHGWRIAVFAVTAQFSRNYFGLPMQSMLACANLAQLSRQIMQARHRFDLIIVSYHGGDENSAAPSEEARLFAQRCIEAGADIIFGHHPHAPQPLELYQERPIFYSLGDFLPSSAEQTASEPATGQAVRLTIRREQEQELKFEIEPVPLMMNPLPQRKAP